MQKKLLILGAILSSTVVLGQRHPFIVDTFSGARKYKEAKMSSVSTRIPIYLGKHADTMFNKSLEERGKWIWDNASYEFYQLAIPKKTKPGTQFKIVVGDSIYTEPEYIMYSDSLAQYYARPVFISNSSNAELIVGQNSFVSIILEAIDLSGHWKPIEHLFQGRCALGLKFIILKPGQMLCVLMPVYKGSFHTKLRYRFGRIVSTEFTGTINTSQFLKADLF
jgi:hypothetical protein